LRITGLPIYNPDDKTPALLHLGGSFSFVYSDTAEIQYRARPESHLAPYLVDTGTINARQAYVFGGEALYLLGPLSFTSEGIASVVLPEAGGEHTFWGAYGEVGWFLTGEQRGYNKTGGFPGRLLPEAPFSFKKRDFGALEIAARYSYLDLTDGAVNGGRMAILMPGVNWYWNQHARWQFNYGFAHVVDGPSPGNLNIFQARFQIVF
jgi:phosphate-selective porin OprO/OprP